MWIIKYTRIWLILGLVLVVSSLASTLFFGLKLGPDFVGGRTLDWNITSQPNLSSEDLKQALIDNGQKELLISNQMALLK